MSEVAENFLKVDRNEKDADKLSIDYSKLSDFLKQVNLDTKYGGMRDSSQERSLQDAVESLVAQINQDHKNNFKRAPGELIGKLTSFIGSKNGGDLIPISQKEEDKFFKELIPAIESKLQSAIDAYNNSQNRDFQSFQTSLSDVYKKSPNLKNYFTQLEAGNRNNDSKANRVELAKQNLEKSKQELAEAERMKNMSPDEVSKMRGEMASKIDGSNLTKAAQTARYSSINIEEMYKRAQENFNKAQDEYNKAVAMK